MWCSRCTAPYDTWWQLLFQSCWRPEAARLSEPCSGNLNIRVFFCGCDLWFIFWVSTWPKFLKWKLVRIWFLSSAWRAELALLPGMCTQVTGKITELHCSLSRKLKNGWKLFHSWVVKLSCHYLFFFLSHKNSFLLRLSPMSLCFLVTSHKIPKKPSM